MIYHPHVHFVVPCGGVSGDGKKWISTPSTFLFPEAVASPIYRKKFREILSAAGLEKHVDPTVWRRWWEVNVKPVSDGRAVLKYLAPYVFRVTISDCSGCRLQAVGCRNGRQRSSAKCVVAKT